MAQTALHVTGDPESDGFVSRDPLGLLIGMILDQQIPIEKAFSSPVELARRLDSESLDAAAIAAMEPDELAALFRRPPALHRYPGSMAARVQSVCRALVEDYDARAEAVWKDVRSGTELLDRLRALPGFGEQKAKIFAALLGKQLRVRPEGWREATAPYGDADAYLSVADITSPETLAKVRANKKAIKKGIKKAGTAKTRGGA